MSKEAKARILINGLLRKSGWRFFDDETGLANIALEAHVKLKKKALEELGDDFEKTAQGFKNIIIVDPRRASHRYVADAATRLTPEMDRLASGGTFKEISKTNFCSLSIPLPPIDVQREIVAELEAERALVDANRKLADIFEKKIEAKLAEIWGEEESAKVQRENHGA